MTIEQLPLARLRFDLQTLEASPVPAYKGDVLRMALLWWLSEFWCPMPDRCRHGCRRPDVCTFGRLCQPAVDPAWSPKIRHLVGDTPPPAYALWDLHDRRTYLDAGAAWGFELTLVGELALRQIPAIVAAVQQGAEQGMGRIRLRSRVRQVVALGCDSVVSASPGAPACCLATEQPLNGDVVLTWHSYHLDGVIIDYGQVSASTQTWDGPVRALSLRYLSPVKIKERGEWVDLPVFSAVMRAVVRRLRILSQVHGAGEWPHAEFGPLLDLAETVRLDHHETFWTGYARHSQRGGRHDMEGFVGQAWYAGDDLRPLLPALCLGQWLHIGKGYVVGNGRYTIESANQRIGESANQRVSESANQYQPVVSSSHESSMRKPALIYRIVTIRIHQRPMKQREKN